VKENNLWQPVLAWLLSTGRPHMHGINVSIRCCPQGSLQSWLETLGETDIGQRISAGGKLNVVVFIQYFDMILLD